MSKRLIPRYGLKALGINCDIMVGQSYVGAAVMKGSFKGVQAVITKEYPLPH